jgi:hypothetical protein
MNFAFESDEYWRSCLREHAKSSQQGISHASVSSALPETATAETSPLTRKSVGKTDATSNRPAISSSNLAEALALASAGLPIFPARVYQKGRSDKWQKQPLVNQWQKVATTDAEQIRKWWRGHPAAVPGIELGRAGVLVIDADRHGGPDGVAALAALAAEHGGLPGGPITTTAGGGEHHVFRQPDGEVFGNCRGSLPAGIDVRGIGGWIVAPGSVRPDGVRWATADGTPSLADAFRGGTIPPLPAWIAAHIRGTPSIGLRGSLAKKGGIPPQTAGLTATGDRRSAGQREASYAVAALVGCADELARAAPGTRNNVLNVLAFRMGRMVARGWIDRDTVFTTLWHACGVNRLVHDDGAEAVRATIHSGLTAGEKAPHPELPERPMGDGYGHEPRITGDSASTSNSATPTTEARRGEGDRQAPQTIIKSVPLRWHGEGDPNADQRWLVKYLLPEVGTGLLSGQWGTGKTFVALDLSASIMTGETFANKRIARRGGVLFFAAEGAREIPIRLKGLVEGKIRQTQRCSGNSEGPNIDRERLPFCWAEECPRLLDDDALPTLKATALAAADQLAQQHGVPLVLIIVDTMIAAASFKDESSASEGQAAMNVLAKLARVTQSCVVAVDHFGKMVETGTRGSSAKEGAADAVLALFGERDIAGNMSSTRLAVRKLRGGATGAETQFGLRVVELGNDRDGEPVTTCVVEWSPETSNTVTPTVKSGGWPKPLKILGRALMAILAEHSRDVRPFGFEGSVVKAVDREQVRSEFYRSYPTADGKTEEQRKEAKRKAFNRNLRDATAKGLIGVREVDGVTMVWMARDDGAAL